jgi:hypothetical protein
MAEEALMVARIRADVARIGEVVVAAAAVPAIASKVMGHWGLVAAPLGEAAAVVVLVAEDVAAGGAEACARAGAEEGAAGVVEVNKGRVQPARVALIIYIQKIRRRESRNSVGGRVWWKNTEVMRARQQAVWTPLCGSSN